MNVIPLTPVDLSLCALLVLLLAASSFMLKIGIHNQLLVSALRCTVQLLLVGFVLKFLFAGEQFFWLVIMAVIMLAAAGHAVCARQQRPLKGWWMYAIGTLSMCISSFTVTYFALQVIIDTTPWYKPQYSIPLLGMLLGNTMNGIAVSIDRLTHAAWQQRAVIEQRLALGQTRSLAISSITRDSMRSGMIPIINTMATTGIVSLPGMMTGQILAGSLPLEAVKYQILIIFLIAAGTGFGVMTAVRLTGRRLFDERHRLRLDRWQG